MKLSLPSAVTRTASRQALVLSKHSPRILFVVGVVGVAATTVSACKATLRVESILDDHQNAMDAIKRGADHKDYTNKDRKHDLAVQYVKTTTGLVRLYAPAIVLGALSITALTSSHNILSRRNAGLTAAYAATDKAFREYRERVVGDLGEDKDREYRFGSEDVTRIVEDKNGPKKEIKKANAVTGTSQYARLFGPDNGSWSPTPEYNIARLRMKQNWLNDRLRARGHLFLNDVYDELEMERTPAGSQVGWVYDPKGNRGGDNYVDFGCWGDENMRGFMDFAMGREEAILLDFNVDGVMWDKI